MTTLREVPVPFLVTPAMGNVESVVVPTGFTLWSVRLENGGDRREASRAGLKPCRETEEPDTPSPSAGAQSRSAQRDDGLGVAARSARPRAQHLLNEALRDVFTEVLDALSLDATLWPNLVITDPFARDHGAPLLGDERQAVVAAAIALDALREAVPGTQAVLTDAAIADRSVAAVAHPSRAPYLRHWAYAALHDAPCLAASRPDEDVLILPHHRLRMAMIVTATSDLTSNEPRTGASGSTVAPLPRRAAAVRQHRAARALVRLMDGHGEALIPLFGESLEASSMMARASGVHPADSVLRSTLNRPLLPTDTPGVFLVVEPAASDADSTEPGASVEGAAAWNGATFDRSDERPNALGEAPSAVESLRDALARTFAAHATPFQLYTP